MVDVKAQDRIEALDWTIPPPIVGPASVVLESRPWHTDALKLRECHQITKGEGYRAGIVDTGIDTHHPELENRIGEARDFTDSKNEERDYQGHGTHVASEIVGKSTGCAPDGKVWMAKGLGDNGSGSSRQIVRALEWLGSQAVHSINMSLGSPYPDPYIRDAIAAIRAAGIPVLAAMGNSGPGPNTGEFPGRWETVTGTAAVDDQLKVAFFSSRSPDCDISGPGVKILGCRAGGGFVEMSGTSMATPLVCGCYGLAWAGGVGGRDPKKIIEIMYRTARDIDHEGLDPNTGWGLVNPLGMLQTVTPPPPVPVPVPPPTPGPCGEYLQIDGTTFPPIILNVLQGIAGEKPGICVRVR